MIMRAKLGLLAAFASMFLFATDATRADDKTQVAVSQGHSVTIKVNVNNGDYVSARDVVMLIQPLDSVKAQSDLTEAIRREAPEGIDIFFDNVGGEQLDAAILNMKPGGRIVISGQVAEYNAATPRGIRWVTPFITKRLKMAGLVVYDYRKRFPEAQARIAGWINDGTLSYREEIIDGFDKLPAAFIGLFNHENFGRRLVKI